MQIPYDDWIREVTEIGQVLGRTHLLQAVPESSLHQAHAQGLAPREFLDSLAGANVPPGPSVPPPPPGASPAGGYYYRGPDTNLGGMGWVERQFHTTHLAVILVASFCCGLPMLILSIIALRTATSETARSNAKISLIFILSLIGLRLLLLLIGALTQN